MQYGGWMRARHRAYLLCPVKLAPQYVGLLARAALLGLCLEGGDTLLQRGDAELVI